MSTLGCFQECIERSEKVFGIMGIDPGTSHLGVCFMWVKFDDLNISHVQTHTLKANKPFHFQEVNHWMLETHSEKALRIRELAHQFSCLLQENRPLYVATETPFISMQTASAFAPLVECIKTLEDVLYSYNPFKPFYRIDTTTAKRSVYPQDANLVLQYKTMTKNKATSKEKVLFCVNHHHELQSHLRPDMDEHAVDAMVIAYAMLGKIRSSDFSQST